MTPTIIGAGIGGLTMALTLQQRGLSPVVYESAAAIRPVGAGIVMASNAMQVYRQMGISAQIARAGHRVSAMKITDERLRGLSLIDLSRYEQQYGVHNVAIHRADLQGILADAIGWEHIRLAKRLATVGREGAGFRLGFEDGSETATGILIGADGIRSVVRQQLFGAHTLRDARQRCWRGLCDTRLPEQYNHTAYEAWGRGRRFGFVRINDRQVYWYAVVSEGLLKDGEAGPAAQFRAFHPDIQAILAATDPDQVFMSELLDLRPTSRWQDGRVCLIGDAAHATTPNLGQGACQAVEDAYTIGRLLDGDRSIEEVFAGYERLRVGRAHRIVRRSWTVGKLAHIRNGLGIRLRNTLMKATPASAGERQMADIFDIGYV